MMTCTGFAFLYVVLTCKPVATPPSDLYALTLARLQSLQLAFFV